MKMELTQEQKDILSYDISDGTVVVKAYAGSGKTFILEKISEKYSTKRILYLAYNKAIAEEAKSRFPSNVKCVTMHSLAYRKVGAYSFNLGNPRKKEMKDCFETIHGRVISWDDCNILQGLYKDYLCISDLDSTKLIDSKDHLLTRLSLKKEHIRPIIEGTYQRMVRGFMPMTHDVYLKMFSVSDINLANEYDIILFDEAQDANPVVLSILNKINVPKVVVGDSHQQIYSWRGSINALSKFKSNKEFTLSKSFRFGESVAELSSELLSNWKKGKSKITGADLTTEINGKCEKYTLICRTNSMIFKQCVSLLENGTTFGFIGGTPRQFLSDLEDIYSLWCGEWSGGFKNPFLQTFDNIEELIEYAEHSNELDLLTLSSIVNNYNTDLPWMIEMIESNARPDGDVLFTTAHKSKGLEWDNVKIAEDFYDLAKRHTGYTDEDKYVLKKHGYKQHVVLQEEEVNLLYVAITRAKKCLVVDENLLEVFSTTKKERKKMQKVLAENMMKILSR
jgi:superfamily I DNA/RNA helicase